MNRATAAFRIIDLSQPVSTGMSVYPGDPEVVISAVLSVDPDGVAVAHLDMGTHTGTHLDAPSHSIIDGRTVDQIPLDMLQGDAYVVRVLAEAGGAITESDLIDALPDRLPGIVCIATGWDQYFGDVDMLHHPYLSLEFAQLLWHRGAKVLGVDTFSPDASGASEMPVHQFWLGNDGVIVENLTGLTALPPRVEVSMFPIKLAGLDGSPIRAIARIRSTEGSSQRP